MPCDERDERPPGTKIIHRRTHRNASKAASMEVIPSSDDGGAGAGAGAPGGEALPPEGDARPFVLLALRKAR